ncbi:hypothetical protein [Flavobacterium sp. GT3P67]|uniref:hypothetical protein n=1 Tax=Flavobacterium sp. GT3P67 TaxID=2541722 RepID=UPI0010475F35|nr:hypothetical protein [Flavobacterium sp. GT3P67]TDE52763.1 hypothetical protein E0H99_11635 [Flavobacterium sp. GT3P67]
MKKLLFTALAVVAFSGVAMANTVEVKEVIKEKNEVMEVLATNIVAEDIRMSGCSDVAGIEVEVAESEYHLDTGNCFDSWTWN